MVKVLLALAIILGIGSLLLLAVQKGSTLLIRVEAVSMGGIEQAFHVPAIIIKNERVVLAPGRGRLENLVREGERARNGSQIGQFYQEGKLKATSISASDSGIISFHPDGWEGILRDFSLENGDRKIFEFEPRLLNDGSFQYEAGDPILKIVDNLAAMKMLILLQPVQEEEPLKVDEQVMIRYGDDYLENAVCEEIWTGDDRHVAILSLPGYYEPFVKERKIEVDCITQRYKGFLVPEKALVENDGEDGVYVIKQEKIKYQPIEVEVIIDGKAVAKGLEEGDIIVTTPSLVEEGQIYR
jgi:putative membrane fusion protein